MKFSHIRGAERVIKVISRLEISFELFLEQCLQVVRLDDFRTPVTVSNMHEVHASAGCPKQGLRVLAAMPTVGKIGSADLCGCRFVKEKIGSADC
jgi:hypothetical protein